MTDPKQQTAIQSIPHAPLARPVIDFTPEQKRIIMDSFLPGCPPQEAKALMEVAKLRGLNPITRQIHFVQRWDSNAKAMRWAYQVSIDGLRAKAEDSKDYDGQSEPDFQVGSDGALLACKVAVYRKSMSHPFIYVARLDEFIQRKKDGEITSMWRKPFMMLSKCAEAGALRKAFPEDLGGLYTGDEMAPDDAPALPRDVTPPPPHPNAPPAAPTAAPTDAEWSEAPTTEPIVAPEEDQTAKALGWIAQATSEAELSDVVGLLAGLPAAVRNAVAVRDAYKVRRAFVAGGAA